MNFSKLVIDELKHSFNEWGMSGSHSEHVNFRAEVNKKALACLDRKGSPITFKTLQKNTFPTEINEAYEHVLYHVDVSDQAWTWSDRLKAEGFPCPYFRVHNRNVKPPIVTRYEKRPEYRSFSKADLDPIHRFTFKPITKPDLIFGRWFLEDKNEASLLGNLFEAWLACHALQHESCFNCKCQNTLRWNGGSKSSWQDLICTACECTYEIKTKTNMEQVGKALQYNTIPGGSFPRWCELKNSRRTDQKAFLVLLPRQFTVNRKHQEVYPVQVAEIATVLPKVHEGTFNRELLSLKSTISVNLNTKSFWFDLPRSNETVDLKSTMEKVFIDRFSKEAFDRFNSIYFESSNREGENVHLGSVEERQENRSQSDQFEDSLVNTLEKLEIVPDCWEDLLEDSE